MKITINKEEELAYPDVLFFLPIEQQRVGYVETYEDKADFVTTCQIEADLDDDDKAPISSDDYKIWVDYKKSKLKDLLIFNLHDAIEHIKMNKEGSFRLHQSLDADRFIKDDMKLTDFRKNIYQLN